jgi:hypothetical protein
MNLVAIRVPMWGVPVLVKIHLRTACGCTKEFFEHSAPMGMRYVVPISGRIPSSQLHPPLYLPGIRFDKSVFEIVEIKARSKRRIELWYEEVPFA